MNPPFTTGLIISTYKNNSALKEILSRIMTGTVIPDEVHISEDSSDLNTSTLINSFKEKYPCVLEHHFQDDLGFRKCKILNESLKFCGSDYIIFLDGDCLPTRHFVQDHMKLAENGYFVQGRRCFVSIDSVSDFLLRKKSFLRLCFSGKIKGIFKGIRLPVPIIRKNVNQRGLIGCNWSVWKSDIVAINGFDEEYEGWGIGEDSDAASRLYNLGLIRKFVYGRAIVRHLDHPVLIKDHLNESLIRLKLTIENKKIRCLRGIEKEN